MSLRAEDVIILKLSYHTDIIMTVEKSVLEMWTNNKNSTKHLVQKPHCLKIFLR